MLKEKSRVMDDLSNNKNRKSELFIFFLRYVNVKGFRVSFNNINFVCGGGKGQLLMNKV